MKRVSGAVRPPAIAPAALFLAALANPAASQKKGT